MEHIQQDFKIKHLLDNKKAVIDYLNEYRDKQINENRFTLPMVIE
jgi:hypothetical protein